MSYRLTVHDDADHTFEYVIELFTRVLGTPLRESFELASKIHEEGRASVNFYDLASAREVEERLLSGGPDPRLPGSRASLVVAIEEIDGATLSLGRVGPRGYERLEERQVAELHRDSQSLWGAPAPRPDDELNGPWESLQLLFGSIVMLMLVLLLLATVR